MGQNKVDTIDQAFKEWWIAQAANNWDYNRLGIARAAYRAGWEQGRQIQDEDKQESQK